MESVDHTCMFSFLLDHVSPRIADSRKCRDISASISLKMKYIMNAVWAKASLLGEIAVAPEDGCCQSALVPMYLYDAMNLFVFPICCCPVAAQHSLFLAARSLRAAYTGNRNT